MFTCKPLAPVRTLLFIILVLSSAMIFADDVVSYDEIAVNTFWKKLYPGGGWSLYCGFRFNGTRKTSNGRTIEIEHIFSPTVMARYAGCNSRMECRESENANFIRMEADLHNMYPVWQTLVTHRYESNYGLVKGEDWRFDDCDIEWKTGVVEPRNIARGNIARALLYMHSTYRIPVDKNLLALYRIWNKMDPPSKQEKARNNIIEKIQGSRNPFIDQPSRAAGARFELLN